MKKIISLAILSMVIIGCDQYEVYINDASNEMKSQPEYAAGLSEIMKIPSPSMTASNSITRLYNLGYLTGTVECDDGNYHGSKFANGLSLSTEVGMKAGDTPEHSSLATLMSTTSYESGYRYGYKYQDRNLKEQGLSCGFRKR